MNKKILELKNVEKFYGNKQVLVNINLNIHEGDFIAVMGPSGSGKTTMINILSSLDLEYKGQNIIDNVDISTLSEEELGEFRAEKLGFVFQSYNLIDSMNGYENIDISLMNSNLSFKERKKRVTEISKLLNINEVIKNYPYKMSGGQQQRVSIARALVKNPSLIIADEPTGALDTENSKVVLEHFKNFNQDKNQTILFVTHDISAASYAKEVIFIVDGKITKRINRENKSVNEFAHILNQEMNFEL